jgi:hypothetical protein
MEWNEMEWNGMKCAKQKHGRASYKESKQTLIIRDEFGCRPTSKGAWN